MVHQRDFFRVFCAYFACAHTTCGSNVVSHKGSHHSHPHVRTWAFLCTVTLISFIPDLIFLDCPSKNVFLFITTNCATIQRKEDNCRIAAHAPPTGYEPNRLDISEEVNVHTSIFQSSDTNAIHHIDDESAPAVIDDELIRNVLTSPLFFMRAKQKPVREKLIKFV